MHKNVLFYTILFTAILTGCRDYDGGYSEIVAHSSPKFDFSTTRAISLNIDYGSQAAGSHVSLYLNDPLANATGPESLPEGEPAFSAYLDEQGRYKGSIQLPTYASRVYAYSEAWNAPSLLASDIDHEAVLLHARIGSTYSQQTATRAESEELQVSLLNTNECTSNPNNTFYTVNGGWDGYGKFTTDLNSIISKGTISVDLISGLQYLLWNNKTTKPTGLDNTKYLIKGEGNPNLFIVDEFVKDGETHKVKDASVYFTFLTEAAWNENTVGYYFYEKNKPPKSFDDLKKYIIIPNASISHHPPFGDKANTYSKFPNEKAPVGINTRIQLLYVDENGVASRNFPVGTEIGFFVMCDAFRRGSGNGTNPVDGKQTERETGKIKTTEVNIWKSNAEFNTDGKHHYIVLKIKEDGTLVYGIEDGTGDKSYEDILFTITATPNEAMDTEVPIDDNIVNPVLPDSQKDKTSNNNHTYAFEDMWPDGGDYDINDAVIRHKQTLTYSAMNYAKTVVDEFTFVQIPDAQTAYTDAFAIQLPENHIEGLSLPTGAEYEEATHSIILTKDVRELYGKTITMTRTFTKAILQGDIHDEDVNPYIINMTMGPTYSQDNRIEIHLPGHQTTSKGLSTGETWNPWYITLDGKFPYGLSFPNNDFNPTAEGQRIDAKYPGFNQWVESGGKDNADWYKVSSETVIVQSN